MNYPLAMHYRLAAGFIVFGICAVFGVRLLYRGLRDDIYDRSGMRIAGRSWFIVGGLFCMVPLVAYLVFLWRQGYFVSWLVNRYGEQLSG
jgi:hypothetical protein